MTRTDIEIIRNKLAEKANKAKKYAERIRSRSEKDMRYDNNDSDYFYLKMYKTEMYALRELAQTLGLEAIIDDDFSVTVSVKAATSEELHIKLETRDGMTRWLETETTDGDKTIIFETFYDAEGVCRSEEIVGWIWGEDVTEEDIKDFAEKKNLKATYEL